jgi:SAM-dependent methyltransferase
MRLGRKDLQTISARTLGHYDAGADAFWAATRDHDVAENRATLLEHLAGAPPFTILDLGCGPGRDLAAFSALGHVAIGLDGAARFVAMARAFSGCEVWQQDFLALRLPDGRFDGVFANASLFHVPRQELPRVLAELRETLKPEGVLFCSNPRGDDREGWQGERYGAYYGLETWRACLTATGFAELAHYYRPRGEVRARQPWLATVWRRTACVRR